MQQAPALATPVDLADPAFSETPTDQGFGLAVNTLLANNAARAAKQQRTPAQCITNQPVKRQRTEVASKGLPSYPPLACPQQTSNQQALWENCWQSEQRFIAWLVTIHRTGLRGIRRFEPLLRVDRRTPGAPNEADAPPPNKSSGKIGAKSSSCSSPQRKQAIIAESKLPPSSAAMLVSGSRVLLPC